MSLNRYAKKQDANHKHIVTMFKLLGCTVLTIGSKDAPDLLVGLRGVNQLVEVKDVKGKLSDGQRQWHDWWGGRKVEVVRTEFDVQQVVWAMKCDAENASSDRADVVASLRRIEECVATVKERWGIDEGELKVTR